MWVPAWPTGTEVDPPGPLLSLISLSLLQLLGTVFTGTAYFMWDGRDVLHVGAETALMAWPVTGRQLQVDPSCSQPDCPRLARCQPARPRCPRTADHRAIQPARQRSPATPRPAWPPPASRSSPLEHTQNPPESPALQQAWHETNGWMRADQKDVGVASTVASGEIGAVGFARKN
ncbi:hypothetical protein ACLOJK_030707 [Asimina triloba]